MAQLLTIADHLGPSEHDEPAIAAPTFAALDLITDFTPSDPDKAAAEFATLVLSSREFRTYVRSGLVLGDLPPALITRLMDYGWGKPPERVEHTGKDGKPIEVVTEVRRTIVERVMLVGAVVDASAAERAGGCG